MWRTECVDQVESEPEPEGWTRRSNKQLENTGRASCDQIMDPIKTVEIDTYRPCSYSNPIPHRSQYHHHHNYYNYQQQQRPQNSYSLPSMVHKAHENFCLQAQVQQPLTPSPSKPRNLHHLATSPRCVNVISSRVQERNNHKTPPYNYMAATASAKARLRSQSAPRQRASLVTPEGEKKVSSARKRLSFQVAGDSNGSRSQQPQRSSVSSRCSDSETSPLRSNEFRQRRWLRWPMEVPIVRIYDDPFGFSMWKFGKEDREMK